MVQRLKHKCLPILLYVLEVGLPDIQMPFGGGGWLGWVQGTVYQIRSVKFQVPPHVVRLQRTYHINLRQLVVQPDSWHVQYSRQKADLHVDLPLRKIRQPCSCPRCPFATEPLPEIFEFGVTSVVIHDQHTVCGTINVVVEIDGLLPGRNGQLSMLQTGWQFH